MPRKARINAVEAMHHIIIRGIERKMIFRNDAGRESFIERLGKIEERSSLHLTINRQNDMKRSCHAHLE